MPRPRRSVWLWGLLLLASLAAGCRRAATLPDQSDAGSRKTPLRPPAGTLAELVAPRPTESYRRTRELLGSAAALLPVTVPVLLASALELPATAAGLFDEQIPPRALLLDRAGSPELVLALHVRSGPELVATLTTGREPSHAARRLGAGRTLLEPKRPGQHPRVLVVDGNTLCVGASAEAVAAAGPYLEQRLSQPVGASALDLELTSQADALSGPVRALLEGAWRARRQELRDLADQARGRAGRAPDFGEPDAVLAAVDRLIEEAVALLGSAARARGALELGAADVRLDLELDARPDGALARWLDGARAGALDALLALPAEVSFAVGSSSSLPSRQQTAQDLTRTLREVLGARLSPPETEQLSGALSALAGARGDELALGVLLEPAPIVTLVIAVQDYEAFDRALKQLLALLQKPAFAAPLERFMGRPRVAFAPVPGFAGEHARLVFAAGRGRAPIELHALWAARQDRVWLGLGAAVKPLRALFERSLDPAAGLQRSADQPRLRRVGDGAGLVLLLDLDGQERDPRGPPLVAGFGARGAPAPSTAWARAQLPALAVNTVLRAAGGP